MGGRPSGSFPAPVSVSIAVVAEEGLTGGAGFGSPRGGRDNSKGPLWGPLSWQLFFFCFLIAFLIAFSFLAL